LESKLLLGAARIRGGITVSAQTSPKKGWRSTTWGELSAAFLGTFVLIAFGDAVVAIAVAALSQSGRGELIFAANDLKACGEQPEPDVEPEGRTIKEVPKT
jgi:hypothetical protein